MAKRVGFIGLGAMGGGMARNVVKKGFSLTVYDIRAEAVKTLEQAGAVAAGSPKEVAQGSQVVLLSLPGPSEVEQVVLGENGALEGAKPGSIVVDLSTVPPSTVKKLAEAASQKGVKVLGAPVSGGSFGAEAGTLAVMVGGDKQAVEECQEVLQTFGSKIFYTGELGTGNVTKIAHNLITNCSKVAILEALVLAVKAGVDFKTFYDVVVASGGNSWIFQNYIGPRVLKRDFEPGMTIDLSHKDCGLALAMADENGFPLLIGALTYQVLTEAQARGFGGKDFTAMLTMLEDIAGQKIS
ncbi:NAD(P)-dependent oxidoreductase [Chloroflexota bacterium]